MMASLWGGKICLQTFLAICFTHVQFVLQQGLKCFLFSLQDRRLLGEHQHQLAHQCSQYLWLWLKWVGQLWQSKLLFCLEICSKNAGLQGSTLSDHCMTTGFGPFELLTCGLLQRGRDYYREGGTTPHLRFVLFWGAQLLVGFQSIMNIQ